MLARLFRDRTKSAPWNDGFPIRSEIFSIERLEEHARSLAATQPILETHRGTGSLARRLAENEKILGASCRRISSAISTGEAITPAGEWLIDNYHVVERQIAEVRSDLPPGYYRQLPKLAAGFLAGYPRVLGVAWAFVAHTDSLFDTDMLRRYLRAYQEVQPLTIGELWAVSITLRIVLIENLSRISKRITDSLDGRRAANLLADRLIAEVSQSAAAINELLIPHSLRLHSDAFLVQMVHRMRDQDPLLSEALEWLDEQFSRSGNLAEAVIRDEHQRQVSAGVTVQNIITSMRLISTVDWSDLFEEVSPVDDILRIHPDYARMDFPTRNLYRSAVEQLSRWSPHDELEVAKSALDAARNTAPADAKEPRSDPGFYLIGRGRSQLEQAIGYVPPLRLLPGLAFRQMGILGYIGASLIVTIALLGPVIILLRSLGIEPEWLMVLAFAGAIPAIDLAVALVNHIVTHGVQATLLPALNFKGNIPPEYRTLVVVPTLLTSKQSIEEQIVNLEIHYLGGPQGDVFYALLSDWTDSAHDQTDADRELLAHAHQEVLHLNQKYGQQCDMDRFMVLHRCRKWNSAQNCWMGWERKRGKLEELNGLLRGAADTSFISPADVPSNVRFVITLDADTRLPGETIGRLIGKLAHPLNRPILNAEGDRVAQGYGVLQPRVTPALPIGRRGSLFLRVFSGATGIDPYAAAISDVYQDLFGEGSYVGKGIYDVDAFQAALAGRVPPNAILSHDLFEGVFARAGLVSDVEVVEEFPVRYDVASLRHHRWARGDWQLLPWIIGMPRTSIGSNSGRRVPAIGRWKMLDNLRRSMSPVAMILALTAGWLLPLRSSIVWTAFVCLTIILPPFIPVLSRMLAFRSGVKLRDHFRNAYRDLKLAGVQSGLMIIFLGHQAYLMMDAIGRTLFRLLFTHRNMLEWVTAAQASGTAAPSLRKLYLLMGSAPIFGVVTLTISLIWGSGTWPLAALFALAWIASPAVASWASQPGDRTNYRPLALADTLMLRHIARRTWRFFDTFVTAQENMLPPDNYQETPAPIVAHRTSPTNIGLYLLSVTAARDFGWIGTQDALQRLQETLATVSGMQKYRGHLFNWYDTRDLRPLEPTYISSVDSGNFAGHLIALANTCRDWRENAHPDSCMFEGVADALAIARSESDKLQRASNFNVHFWKKTESCIAAIEALLHNADQPGQDRTEIFERLQAESIALSNMIRGFALEDAGATADDLQYWADAVLRSIKSHKEDLEAMAASSLRCSEIESLARRLAMEMDFSFLINTDRMLLSIGFQVAQNALDTNCYDLLASEARLASFLAIAKGDVPTRHWFRLGRTVTPLGHGSALISWSGSMFEYLMPSLVMQAPAESLIELTNRLIVGRHISYAKEVGIPWGISESAYNARDLDFTYQYSNFGVPGLGLKRGLADNMVVSPYATALASMIDAQSAVRNFQQLSHLGAMGRFGMYEALDFTASRIPDQASFAIVQAFMAHHQGMSIASITNALFDGILRRRFHAEPLVQAAELLLQEQVPRNVTFTPPLVSESSTEDRVRETDYPVVWNPRPDGAMPATHFLSNGNLSIMLTAAGGGFSKWKGLAITRWREDATKDDSGSYIYLRDMGSGEIWSPTLQPLRSDPLSCSAVFNEDRAVFEHHSRLFATKMAVLVSAEDDAEVRRIEITNLGDDVREVELTSYAELVLAPQASDVAHPAFSKMFVETEYLTGLGAILATRRKRDPDEPDIWAAHLAVVDGQGIGKREFETDRLRFLGRGGSSKTPASVIGSRQLSGAVGHVLDPIFSLRRCIRIAPGATARVDFWTMVAGSRKEILDIVDKHHDVAAFERAASLSWTQAQVQLHHLGIDRTAARQYQKLAGHIVYATPEMRASSDAISTGRAGQPVLWSMGISGDLPIILLRISELEHLGLVKEVIQAVEYWRLKQLAVDLVIINERAISYVQDLQTALENLVRASQSRSQIGDTSPGGHIFMLRADLVAPAARSLLLATARVILIGARGRLTEQMSFASSPAKKSLPEPKNYPTHAGLQMAPQAPGLEYFNGLGGFSEDGREYVILLGPGQSTPAPWINVIANPTFGFQVSAEGSGFSWSHNSREHQLTAWSNDAVADMPSEAIYLKDLDSGDMWTPTAQPIRSQAGTYECRHGWGYSRFEHSAHGISASLVQFAGVDDPIKISRLKLHNVSGRERKLSVTAYVEWALGTSRAGMALHTGTRIDAHSGAIFADNYWNPAFAGQVAFADLGGRQTSFTADRREFIGRNGSLSWPAAIVANSPLSGRTGVGLDPCAALQVVISLAANESTEIIVFLGDAPGDAAARALLDKYRSADLDSIFSDVQSLWKGVTGSVQVKTPDRSMDIMLNGWLNYQALSCRVWGRSGFYQASGAYGFRDQLQDSMALASIVPTLTREHLLRAAGRQFREGDVQHWWLPHSGQGVRTRISDDRVWLAHATAHYLKVTDDMPILDEMVPFLEGQILQPDEHESFFQPGTSDVNATLFEHCALGLDASLAAGSHGLPLMGGGDWNDGMNRVGIEGGGESVWLGWFLYATLERFLPLAEARHDFERVQNWRQRMLDLQNALRHAAWDGHWFKRAWFDDGTPLGSAANDECRIDSIAQSWSVLSGAATSAQAAEAMAAVERELTRPQDGLALLFAPPFDQTSLDPGYIKGYPPGVRENGGQYTQAALWSVMALARLGEGDKAAALFWMLNSINHARTRSDIHRYKVEPYVVAADVYASEQHLGRGGWTWYTGSAGWMQRAGIESILGLSIEKHHLVLNPCIPSSWPSYTMVLRRGNTHYDIRVDNPHNVQSGVLSAFCDDAAIATRPPVIPFVDDGGRHQIVVTLGKEADT